MSKFVEWRRKNPVLLARTALDLSRADFATSLDVSYGAVQLWESGSIHPNAENMESLCRFLGKAFESRYKKWLVAKPGGRVRL